MNQCFKANYIKITFTRICNFLDEDSNANVMNWRISLNIADCVNYVKEAIDQIKPHSVNACWKNLWSECVTDFKGFSTAEDEVANIVAIAHHVGGDGFDGLHQKEI